MKKFVAFSALALLLAGCGQSSNSSPKGVSKGCKKTQRFSCDPKMPKKKSNSSRK